MQWIISALVANHFLQTEQSIYLKINGHIVCRGRKWDSPLWNFSSCHWCVACNTAEPSSLSWVILTSSLSTSPAKIRLWICSVTHTATLFSALSPTQQGRLSTSPAPTNLQACSSATGNGGRIMTGTFCVIHMTAFLIVCLSAANFIWTLPSPLGPPVLP